MQFRLIFGAVFSALSDIVGLAIGMIILMLGSSKGLFFFSLDESTLDSSALVRDGFPATILDSFLVVSQFPLLPISFESYSALSRCVTPYSIC